MKDLYTYINEALEELYHFTNDYNLVAITKSDTFEASPDDGHSPKGFDYYISATRSKNANTGYPTQMWDNEGLVRIVLDGRKINSKMKIKPLDFSPSKGRAIKANWKNKEDFDKYKADIMMQSNVEAEDRILLNKPEIKNFHTYIKEIHICKDNIDKDRYVLIKNWCNAVKVNLIEFENMREFNRGKH